MAKWPPVTASEYYEVDPSLEHRAGDVWLNLPALGNIPVSYYSGLIVTPACDLQGRKTCALTYLPILPLRCAFYTHPLLTDVCRAFNGQLPVLKLKEHEIELKAFELPDEPSITRVEDECKRVLKSKGAGEKEKLAVERVTAAIQIFRIAGEGDISKASIPAVKRVLGAEFEKLMDRVIRNAYRPDVHFLPRDNQDAEWSGMPEHSLVFFRHAASLPVRILDGAQDVAIADWRAEVQRLKSLGPGRASFLDLRPSKRLTVKPRYFADIQTRYISMHVRLGSPDFTDDTVSRYTKELD